jgi:hypothetical protein
MLRPESQVCSSGLSAFWMFGESIQSLSSLELSPGCKFWSFRCSSEWGLCEPHPPSMPWGHCQGLQCLSSVWVDVQFLVSCKNVGFMIYKLKSFSCKSFAIFFHLWSGGGPNWQRDYELWCHEQQSEWTLVGSKSKKSFADWYFFGISRCSHFGICFQVLLKNFPRRGIQEMEVIICKLSLVY